MARHLLIPGESTEGLNTVLDMEIKGYRFEAVLDTGADVIVISHELASCLGFKYETAEEIEILNAEAGLRGMKGYDWPDFQFTLGKSNFQCRAVVAPIIDHMLIGNNFIKGYKADILNSTNRLRVNGEEFTLRYVSRTKRASILFPVRVARKTRIKPRTIALVKVNVESRPDQVELAEGCCLTPTLRSKQLLIPNGYLNKNGEGWITVRNHSDYAAILKQDKILGHGQAASLLSVQRDVMEDDLSSHKIWVRKVTALNREGSPIYDSTMPEPDAKGKMQPPPDVMLRKVGVPYDTEDDLDESSDNMEDPILASRKTPQGVKLNRPPDPPKGEPVDSTADSAGAPNPEAAAPEPGGAKPPEPEFEPRDGLPEDHPYYVSMEQIRANRQQHTPSLDSAKLIDDTQFEYVDAGDVFIHACLLPRWLHDSFTKGCRNLTFDQMVAFCQLLFRYQDVFSRNDQDLGCFKGLRHSINTGTAAPVTSGMRRTPLGLEKEEEEQIQKMLAMGVIQPSSSDWSSAPVMVKKKDGSIRYCIDFRKLNDVTIKDQFPMPLINECIDSLAGTSFFSALDLSWGYWQIELSQEDRHKTAFATKHGLFEHTRMPFGLCNAPSTFMRAMTLVLKGMSWEEVLAYLDDVIVTGKGFWGHLQNLQKVLERLRWHNLKLKPRKCEFFNTEVDYLGRTVTRGGVKVAESKAAAVRDWPVPQNVADIQSFMGLIGYHREFVKGLAELAEPLYQLTAAKAKWEWTPERQKAFDDLRHTLTSAPVLAYPDPKLPFILDVDASGVGIGAELIQVVDGVERVIAYASHRLTPAQRNYCTTRRELLAVVKYTNQFRHYLLGRRFTIRTDHSSLTWLCRFKHPEGQLARWLEELSQYDMKLVHRQGAKHGNADALSRRPDDDPFCKHYSSGIDVQQLPCGGCKYCTRCHLNWERFNEEVDDVESVMVRSLTSNWFPQYSPEELRQKQLEDPILGPILKWLEEGDPEPLELSLSEPHTRQLWSNRVKLLYRQEVLFYKTEQDGAIPSRTLLLIPESMKTEILESCHDHVCAGHMGRDKTFDKCRKQFYWVGQFRDIAKYTASCKVCLFAKRAARAPRAAQVAYQAGMAMERVQLDILGPFKPTTARGNQYILMMIDQFPRRFECAPLQDVKAETVARTAVEQFFCRLGFPTELHTDQGKNVDGQVIRAMCELLGIKKTRTTPYHPASNGEIERQNRTLLCLIRAYAHDRPGDWDRYLPYLAGAMRSAVNKATGETANRMMLGREVATPTHLSLGLVLPTEETPSDSTEFADQLAKTLAEVHKHVRLRLKTHILKQKRDADIRLNIKTYLPGDVVYRIEKANKRGVSPKLRSQVKGPFVVHAQTGAVTYQILDRRCNSTKVHHDMLIPGAVRDIPKWAKRLSKKVIEAPSNPIFIPGFEQVYSLKQMFGDGEVQGRPKASKPTELDKDPGADSPLVDPTVDEDAWDPPDPLSLEEEEDEWPFKEEEEAREKDGVDPYDTEGLDNLHEAGSKEDPSLPPVQVNPDDFLISDQLAEEIRDPNYFCGLNQHPDAEETISSHLDYTIPSSSAASVQSALMENATPSPTRRTRSGRIVHPNRKSDYVY